ncbi:uncharacterized protein LOC112088585 [Eutrema salsugineum]|uniref:uncharacterized protein LOC112088585 n=1 Tax=Eutrema salsugineum TaxID=72664 RepID=UPI000CED5457|nr:uncharacterized protein LOC112088585 [Eutrema salsugineum]
MIPRLGLEEVVRRSRFINNLLAQCDDDNQNDDAAEPTPDRANSPPNNNAASVDSSEDEGWFGDEPLKEYESFLSESDISQSDGGSASAKKLVDKRMQGDTLYDGNALLKIQSDYPDLVEAAGAFSLHFKGAVGPNPPPVP